MQRKLLALILTVAVVLSMMTTSTLSVQAATTVVNAEQIIEVLGIMKTDQGSKNAVTAKVTRGEFAQMLLNISSFKGKVASKSNVSLFKDVSKTYWASGYIQTALKQGWMSGYLNGSFKPDRAVTLQEAVNGILKLLGYSNSDFVGSISLGQMALYTTKNLDKNITKTKSQYLTRSDCMNLIYNTLTTTTKEGKVYAETLGYTVDAGGEIDYLSLINVEMEGPIVVNDNWKSDIPFSLGTATYYRNGVASNYSAIKEYDVIYYSEKLKTILAYDNKVTGTIQSISPNLLAPTSVTVSEKQYTLGSNDMSIEFSTLGNTNVGDTVTLLLGKDDSVVEVLSIDELNTSITGVVLEAGEHLSTDSNEKLVYSDYIKFVDAEGILHQQDYDVEGLDFSKGDLARITYNGGKATVSEYTLGSTTFGDNTFSTDGSTLGNCKSTASVKILDLYKGQYTSVNQKRLANVVLGSSTVCYYELNENDEITQLILNNVTGDMYNYGILKGVSYQNNSTNTTYSYIIDGVISSVTAAAVADYNLYVGPKGFLFDGKELVATLGLAGVQVVSLGTSSLQSSSAKYPLADNTAVYYLKGGVYYATTIAKVSDLTKYKLTAYFDRTIASGGQVRVIVAENIN